MRHAPHRQYSACCGGSSIATPQCAQGFGAIAGCFGGAGAAAGRATAGASRRGRRFETPVSFFLLKQAATTRGSATPRADSAKPWARHGDDSDCFYCGDFDSEEEIAHYLDLDDEWGITKS